MTKYPDPDDVSCPKTLSVPSESVVSTLAPVTPVPGKQGATGESGGDVSIIHELLLGNK